MRNRSSRQTGVESTELIERGRRAGEQRRSLFLDFFLFAGKSQNCSWKLCFLNNAAFLTLHPSAFIWLYFFIDFCFKGYSGQEGVAPPEPSLLMKDARGDLPAYFSASSVMQTLYRAVVTSRELEDKAPNLPVNLCSYPHLWLQLWLVNKQIRLLIRRMDLLCHIARFSFRDMLQS